MDELLDAPCAFCGYNGAGYWQAQTHPQECPWHAVGGGDERAAQLRDIVTNAHDELARLRTKLAEVERERDALKMQAEIWAQEARAQRTTVHDIYRLCTGGKGEPGDWNGAEPVRELVARADRLEAALRDAIECVEGWGAYAPEYFKNRWDLAGDMKRLRGALEGK